MNQKISTRKRSVGSGVGSEGGQKATPSVKPQSRMGKGVAGQKVRKTKIVPGMKFNRFTAIHRIFVPPSLYKWVCRCDCGKVKAVVSGKLVNGTTKSCGCLKAEIDKSFNLKHGDSRVGGRTREYECWAHIVRRCCNPNSRDWKYYGGAGVKMDKKWRASFAEFLSYMGRKPSKNHSIDRHPDPNGNYEPGNVRWATVQEQARNHRNAVIFPNDMRAIDVAKKLGVDISTIWRRLKRGLTKEEVFSGKS